MLLNAYITSRDSVYLHCLIAQLKDIPHKHYPVKYILIPKEIKVRTVHNPVCNLQLSLSP